MEAERSSQRPSKPTKLNLNTNPGIVRDKDAIKYWKISQTNKQTKPSRNLDKQKGLKGYYMMIANVTTKNLNNNKKITLSTRSFKN